MLQLKKIYQFLIPKATRAYMHVCFWKVKSLFVIGNNVNCNCCNSSFSKFLDYGDYKKRENAICPNCLSIERTRLLWYFLEGSDYLKNKSILQFAPFKAVENKIKNKGNVNYISGDIDAMLAMKKIDITNINYPDFSFDVILCSHVISVVKKDIKAINEMFRVLKPKGTLILQEHIFEEFETTFEDFTIKTDNERYNTYGKHYLQRCYGKDFTARFINAGFSIKIYNPKDTLTKDEIKNYGLQNSGMIHLFTKN